LEFKNWEDSSKLIIQYSQVFEVKIKDQVIYLDPPMEEARFYWM
jgi:hypothetical protein